MLLKFSIERTLTSLSLSPLDGKARQKEGCWQRASAAVMVADDDGRGGGGNHRTANKVLRRAVACALAQPDDAARRHEGRYTFADSHHKVAQHIAAA